MTLRESLRRARAVRLGERPRAVERLVAEEWVRTLSPSAAVLTTEPRREPEISIATGDGDPAVTPWMRLRAADSGDGEMSVSAHNLLFAFFTLVTEEWADTETARFREPVTIHPSFPWLRNLSDFFVGSLRTGRGFDAAAYVRQLARAGFTHVTVNGLGVPRPFESGPPGDVYFWFYDYSPDLDQFVDSTLLRGYYPTDYLQANLRALRRNAELVRRYGLVPGLHINSPRSMPEEFWLRYGFLRGARVDHPRETLRPRYTLAMAHPVVQQHYRELIRKILREIPDLGFVHIWTNDSGAGFEFVSSLYAGRNGGPYLLREWKSDEEIARKASDNVLTYYRLLRDECRAVNPSFRLVCDLGPFYAERPFLIPELGQSIDAGEFAYFEKKESSSDRECLTRAGAWIHTKVDAGDNNILGVAYPWLIAERLRSILQRGDRCILTGCTPESLAPYDINTEIIRATQLMPDITCDEVIRRAAERWAGPGGKDLLLALWQAGDQAVRSFPPDIPMSTFGFPWFRLWVRPFVPDIDAIPLAERKYYEDFLLATFNNPARIDLNNDMMWNFLTVEQARERKERIDRDVLPPLDAAIERSARDAALLPSGSRAVVKDQTDRLQAYRCFCTTLRNTMAWTESVHGFLRARPAEEREACRNACKEMVDAELTNARTLLHLWKTSTTPFMPISALGESLHMYADNFGELLERKISLMERHRNDTPAIDHNYMWRMPDAPVTVSVWSNTQEEE